MVAAHLDLGDHVLLEPHLDEDVVEIFGDRADFLVVQPRPHAGHGARRLAGEPDDLVGVVDPHVDEQAGAAVPLGRAVRVLEDGDDLEDLADAPFGQQLFCAQQRRVEAGA